MKSYPPVLSGSEIPKLLSIFLPFTPSLKLRSPHTHRVKIAIAMISSTSAPFVNGGVLLSPPRLSSASFKSSPAFKWGLQKERNVGLLPRRITGQAIRVLANPNASSGKGKAKKEVFMVDPVEAKRLAAKQMELIKAKEKFEKRRRIEAINGAWAMLGLTAGLIIEGHTGKNIPSQLVGYWDAVIGLFLR